MNFYRRYSLVLLLKPSLTLDGVRDMESVINNLISGFGKVKAFNYCDIKQLSYVIKKHKVAHFVQLVLELVEDRTLGTNIKELNRKMSLNDNILRSLLLLTDETDEHAEQIKNFNTPSING
jgi:ribosomal protein S6